LPNQTQNQVLSTVDQILTTNVDDVATNGFSRVQNKGLVLTNFVNVKLALVDDTLVDSIGDGVIDQFAYLK
jgi:hypothetical protein